MPYKYFADQYDDEEVLYVFRRHPIVQRRGLIYGMLGLLAGTIPGLIVPEYTWFFGGLAGGVILGIILYLPSWISWYFSLCIMTDQRFIQINQKGLFNRSVGDLRLKHIQSLNYEVTGIEQTLLGYGTIILQTYLGEYFLAHIHHPAKTLKKMTQIMRDLNIEPGQYPADSENYEEKA